MKKIIKQLLSGTQNSLKDEPKEMNREDRELYLFLRGGFTAK